MCEPRNTLQGGYYVGLSGRYVALSGFYVVWRFFGLKPDAYIDRVLDRAREFSGLGCDRGDKRKFQGFEDRPKRREESAMGGVLVCRTQERPF